MTNVPKVKQILMVEHPDYEERYYVVVDVENLPELYLTSVRTPDHLFPREEALVMLSMWQQMYPKAPVVQGDPRDFPPPEEDGVELGRMTMKESDLEKRIQAVEDQPLPEKKRLFRDLSS
jgi:hypothetical protein